MNPNEINSQDLQPNTNPLQPVEAPQPDNAGLLGTTQGAIDYTNLLTQQQAQADQAIQGSQSDITNILSQLEGQTADVQAANEASGLNAATRQLNQLNAQASQLNREAQAIPLQIQEQFANTGATDRGVEPIQTAQLRNNAIRALSIAQQADVASANLTAAQAKAQQMIDLKYEPLKAQLATKQLQYQFNKDNLEAIDKKAAKALEVSLKKEERDLLRQEAIEKDNSSTAQNYAKYALDGGQSDLASQISALDPASDTFREDLSALQSQIKNPMLALDLKLKQLQVDTAAKNLRLLGEPSAKELEAERAALETARGQVTVMQDKANLISSIEENKAGLKARVGTTALNRKATTLGGKITRLAGLPFGASQAVRGSVTDATGQGQQFAGAVHRLSNTEFIDKLVSAKAQGATFGALNQQEADSLRSAATQLNDWEIKDKNGNPTGVWNIDEASFNREISRIKYLTNLSLARSQGTVFNESEDALLDEAFTLQQESLSPSNYY